MGNHAADGAEVYTDGAKAYRGIPNHQAVQHGVGEYVRGQSTPTASSHSGRCSSGATTAPNHRMSVKHLQRYVNEFCGRHNVRDFDTIDQMTALVVGLVGKRLQYRELTGDTRGWAV